MTKPDTEAMYKLIADAPIGRYIGDRGARIFSEKCASSNLNDNDYLFRKDDKSSSFFIVAEGRLA